MTLCDKFKFFFLDTGVILLLPLFILFMVISFKPFLFFL